MRNAKSYSYELSASSNNTVPTNIFENSSKAYQLAALFQEATIMLCSQLEGIKIYIVYSKIIERRQTRIAILQIPCSSCKKFLKIQSYYRRKTAALRENKIILPSV